MRSLTRPIGLLVTTLFLSFIFTNTTLAFECTNAGAGATAPDDGDIESNTACGDGAIASIGGDTALGSLAVASGGASTALGSLAVASGGSSTAVGWDATASGIVSTAVGWYATASESMSAALGGSAIASGGASTALGYFTTASGIRSNAVGVGALALAPHINATAVGYRAQVEQSNAMVLGSIPGVNEETDVNEYVDVGIGTSMPQAPLHVERANGAARVQVTETQPGPSMPFQGVAQGLVRFELNDEAAGERWRFTNAGSKFAINNVGDDSPGTEVSVFKNGDMVIGGLLTENSDRDAKQDIVPVDRRDVLAKISSLPIVEWSYKDEPGQRHVGPMAQDFYAAFGLGRNEKGISTLDTSGVALAGIQALAEDNAMLREQVEQLRSQHAQLQEVVLQMQDEQRARRVRASTAFN